MASYRFKWPHSADKVIVTGTFDDWGQKIELDNKGRYWEKVIPLSATKEKIHYKYIVNGQWRTDPSHAVEKDHEGNENNVLDPEDIIYDTAIMNSTGPDATTSALAGQQPIESRTGPQVIRQEDNKDGEASAAEPIAGGGTPITNSVGPDATTVGLAGAAAVGVAGVGAAAAVASKDSDPSPPGAFPTEAAEVPKGTLQDTVVGISPIPATGTGSNPVKLEPGDRVPDPGTLTGNTIESTVRHDKDTYERGSNGAAYSPVDKSGGTSTAYFGRPAAGGTFIPESSSFMNDTSTDNISSVGPGATTTALAGQQPIEPRGTPEVVKKEDGSGGGDVTIPAIIGGGAVAAGTAGAISSVGPDATSTSLAGQQPIEPRGQPEVISKSGDQDPNISSVGPGATTAGLAGQQPIEGDADRSTSTTVPSEVTESQKEANVDPEASANAEAVKEKSAAENELLSKVQETDAKGEPAPTDSAATATTVPTSTSESGAPQLGDPTGGGLAPIKMDDNKPTIATKEALMGESGNKDGLNASAESEAKPPTAPATAAATTAAAEHRDVSPGTPHPDGPQVTSGVGESSTPQTSTPQKQKSAVDQLKSYGTSESPGDKSTSSAAATPDSKKSKRRSFFKRIKDKLNS